MEVTRRWFGLTALCGALLPAVPALAIAPLGSDPGVFDDRIVFGQSAALKGSAAALGLGMRMAYWRRSMRRTPLAAFMAASSI
jgi:hypothetical protein